VLREKISIVLKGRRRRRHPIVLDLVFFSNFFPFGEEDKYSSLD